MDRDLWMPVETWAAVANADELTSREFRWFKVIGRLAPGATVAQVNQQVAAIAKTLETLIHKPIMDVVRVQLATSDTEWRRREQPAWCCSRLSVVWFFWARSISPNSCWHGHSPAVLKLLCAYRSARAA